MYHLGPADATPKSKKLSRGNRESPLDFSARCGIVGLVESVRDTDRTDTLTGTDRAMTNKDDTTKAIEAIEGVTIEPLIVIDADGTETGSEMYRVDSAEALKALFDAFESAN